MKSGRDHEKFHSARSRGGRDSFEALPWNVIDTRHHFKEITESQFVITFQFVIFFLQIGTHNYVKQLSPNLYYFITNWDSIALQMRSNNFIKSYYKLERY